MIDDEVPLFSGASLVVTEDVFVVQRRAKCDGLQSAAERVTTRARLPSHASLVVVTVLLLSTVAFGQEFVDGEPRTGGNRPAAGEVQDRGVWVARSSSPSSALESIYADVALARPDAAADRLGDEIDSLLSGGRFADCDTFLAQIDLSRLDANLCTTLLGATRPGRLQLTYRRQLVSDVADRLGALIPQERVDAVLRALG